MRKTLLFIAAGIVALGANAKDVHKNAHGNEANVALHKNNAKDVHITPVNHHLAAKATAAAFYSEHFDSALPAGWTTGADGGVNGTWKWFPNGQQSGSQYHIDAIATTTGFMIYDSDSIGAANPSKNPVGWMKTAAINCTSHSTVAITFNEYFRSFNDSCFVDVSNDGTNWTRYAVNPNNNLNGNDYVSTNPYNVFINATTVAGGHATVYVRFYYYGPVDGGYSWQVDDLALAELEPHNVAVHDGFLYSDSVGTYASSIGNVPFVFADSISPVIKLDNLGANAENASITATIYKNATQVYTNTMTSALPISAQDSLVEFPYYDPGQTASSIGDYQCVFTVSVTGNANTTQLTDTVSFSVTDTIWSQNQGLTSGGYYVHRPATLGESSFFTGTRFDVPAGASDTITGISVAFDNSTTPNSVVQVQVYQLDNPSSAGWIPKYATLVHTLSGTEISTNSNLVYAFLPMDLSGSQYPILTEGTWAAVVTAIGAPASSTVTVLSTAPNPATPYAGFFGQSDTSHNNGDFDFGFQNEATGITSIPLVRLHFGVQQGNLNIANVSGNVNIGVAYPNPANNTVSIPFTLATDANVNVSIMNTAGQVISSQSLGKVASGSLKTTTFSTAGLANGMYFYSIDVDGVRNTGRFAVTH